MWRGDLEREGIADDGVHRLADALDQARVVGGDVGGGVVRTAQDIGVEALRCLYRTQTRAIGRADHSAHEIHGLDGVDDRQNRNDGGAAGAYLGHDASDQRRWSEGPGGVVDQHDGCVTDSSETGSHRIGALDATRYDEDVGTHMAASDVEKISGDDDDDAIDGTRGPQPVHGPRQQRIGTQTDECLRLVVSEPKAFACSGYQRDYVARGTVHATKL